VSERQFRVIPAGVERERFRPLLLLADDSEQQVSSYEQLGDLYAFERDGRPLAIALALPFAPGTVELKAVAVDAAEHGKGIGQALLAAAIADLRERGVRRVVLGTGNSGIGQIAFYQKAGFRMWKIERDFFSEARGYPPDLEENGIPLRDMIWFDRELGPVE
jgi:ribosomal protein S18 acetylase RimI-like enzyme